MTDKQTFILAHAEARRRAQEAVRMAPDGHSVTIKPPGRNLDQNAAMWPCLRAFADQLQWPINGKLETLTRDEWKTILSAGWRREAVRVAPGIDGGMVMLGESTSRLSKREFGELLEFIHATAAHRGVVLERETA